MRFSLPITFSILLISLLSHPASAQRKLVWSDEFNYNGYPDSTKWDYEVGFVRNKEPQYYTHKKDRKTAGSKTEHW
jgi:hypothetical protein